MATAFGQNLSMQRPWQARILTRQAQFALDLFVLVAAFAFSYLLRFDFAIPSEDIGHLLIQLPYVITLQFGMLLLFGVYAFIWRYIGISEVKTFSSVALWSALPLVVLRLWLPDAYHSLRVPLSVIIVDTVLAFGTIASLRVFRRIYCEHYEKKIKGASQRREKKSPVLLIGAGLAGVLAANEIQRRGDSDLIIRGFIDDDPQKQKAMIHGVKVLGTTHDLPRLVQELGIDHVVISIAQTSRQNFRRILDICEQIPIKVRIIPSLYEILQGRVKVSRIRDVQIEDLLGREPVQLDEKTMSECLTAKRIMVTGAGGSIGSELARQAARFIPYTLLLVERAEFALFNIERELRETCPGLNIVPLVADICDESRMRALFNQYRPHVVLHSAAHKHVPMMEWNPTEAVKNNVLGTSLVGELAGEYGAEVVVLISSDKAVRPRSVMGATKRVAELVVQSLNGRFETRYLAVRFGNVIGSAGSVIPIFREQIRKGGPVTVTHKDMKRYFMTIPEAAQLVLQAGAMGEGGEIFILDMGEPVNILDLAKETITLSGLRPYEDIDIVFTGIRAGEKLYEELETTDERVLKTRHPKIYIGKIAPYQEEEVKRALKSLSDLAHDGRVQELSAFLNDLLPEAELDLVNKTGTLPNGGLELQQIVA